MPVTDGAAPTVMVKPFEAACCGPLLSRTVTMKLNVPATVGVPKTAPVVALIPMPLGSPLADHIYGGWPPAAAMACCAPYPTPTFAVGGLSVVVVIKNVEARHVLPFQTVPDEQEEVAEVVA